MNEGTKEEHKGIRNKKGKGGREARKEIRKERETREGMRQGTDIKNRERIKGGTKREEKEYGSQIKKESSEGITKGKRDDRRNESINE